MTSKKTNAGKAPSKKRFNSVDALIVAAFLLILFVLAMRVFSPGGEKTLRIVTIGVDPSDREQLSYAGIGASEGTKVYDAASGEPIGTLEKSYSSGDASISVLVDGEGEGRTFVYGQTLDVRAGNLICCGAVVIDIEEVQA